MCVSIKTKLPLHSFLSIERKEWSKRGPHTVDAHCMPMPLNMYVEKRGNAPAKSDRMNVFPATADAANMRYASMM